VTTTPRELAIVDIKHRDESGITVECPYCGLDHTHRTSGFNTALCGQGSYSAVTPWAATRKP